MKPNILVNTLNLTREEWLDWRNKGIGGSDVGAICGINKWKSAFHVYMDKIGQRNKEDIQSDSAYFGTILEDVVAKEFEKRSGKKVRRRNAMLQHPEYPFMLANVDREVVGENAILECKTVSEYGKDDWADDKIPESYQLQVQHYIAVGGYDKGYIACLIGGNKFVWYEIARDEELISYVIEIEQNFWHNHVVREIPPAVDGSDASTEMIKKKYNKAEEGTAIQLESNYNQMILEREIIAESIKELETKKAEIENKIKEEMKENETAETENYVVSWKNVKGRETFDTKRFKAEHSDIAEKYIKHGEPSRKFEIKRRK